MRRVYFLLLVLVFVAVSVYSVMSRIPTDVLVKAVVIGVALGVSIPLTIGVILLYRSIPRESIQYEEPQREYQQSYQPPVQYTQPQVLMIPPMQLQPTRQQMQNNWMNAPIQRQYTMIGEGAEE